MTRALGVTLALLACIPATGCATILFPERSLVPESERGDLDVAMLAGDIVLSIPFFVTTVTIAMAASAGGGGFNLPGESSLAALAFPPTSTSNTEPFTCLSPSKRNDS